MNEHTKIRMDRPYYVQKVEQGSPEWLELRKKYIGCSELAALFLESPWMNRVQLSKLKRGEFEVKDNPFMARGRALEPEALELYNKQFGKNLKPMVLKSKGLELIASMDGYDEFSSTGCEIKCPSYDNHQNFLADKELPRHYWIQIQGQLFVTGATYIDYVSYYRDDRTGKVSMETRRVCPDAKFQTSIAEAVTSFYYEHDKNTVTNYPKVKSKQMQRWLIQYAQLQTKLKVVENEIDEMRQRIADANKDVKAGCWSNVEFSWTERKGTVDYAKVPELKDVNLDQYRKPTQKVFSIKIRPKT